MQSAVPERNGPRALRRIGVIAAEPAVVNGAAPAIPAGLPRHPSCAPPACCAPPAHPNV
jgi:hypothetical protein